MDKSNITERKLLELTRDRLVAERKAALEKVVDLEKEIAKFDSILNVKNTPEKDGMQPLNEKFKKPQVTPEKHTPEGDGMKPLNQPYRQKPILNPIGWPQFPTVKFCAICHYAEGYDGSCTNLLCSRNQPYTITTTPWCPSIVSPAILRYGVGGIGVTGDSPGWNISTAGDLPDGGTWSASYEYNPSSLNTQNESCACGVNPKCQCNNGDVA